MQMSAKHHAWLPDIVSEKGAATGIAFGGENLRRKPIAE